MPSTTVRAVRQRALRKVIPLLGMKLDPVRTATAGGAALITDSAAALPSATVAHFDGWFIKVATSTDGNDPEGDVRAVSAGGFAIATGAFTSASNFSAAPASGDTFEVSPFDPSITDEIIKELVRELYMPSLFPLSMHIVGNDNNDMEGTGIDGDYTKSNCTVTQESTIVHGGANSAKVTSSAADGGIYPATLFPVNENASYYAAVLSAVRRDVVGDVGNFYVYDENNSETIITAVNDEEAWMELILPFTVPSDCEKVSFWMVSVANGDITYWNDFQVWRNGNAVYPLPSWITRKEQVEDVIAFPRGSAGPGTNDYHTNEHMSYGLNWHFEREDITAASELHIAVDNPGENRPYIVVSRALPEPSSDSSAINFEPELLAFGTAARLLQRVPDKTDEQNRQMLVFENAWKGGLRTLGMGVNLDSGRAERVWA